MSPALLSRLARWGIFLSAWVNLHAAPPSLNWTNNLLAWEDPRLPGGKLEIWYLEAFLKPGARDRDWRQSVLPHKTVLVSTSKEGRELRLRTQVDPDLEVHHRVGIVEDGLELEFDLHNQGPQRSPAQWFQPACIRVAAFTGRDQREYIASSFVWTTNGMTPLDRLNRTTNALYLGGQVFLPPWTRREDANPRPAADNLLTNGLIGCFSADRRWILATASDRTHELFEGVYVCLHSDPLIAGLEPGERRRIRQKIYLVPNDVPALLRRYRSDFPSTSGGQF